MQLPHPLCQARGTKLPTAQRLEQLRRVGRELAQPRRGRGAVLHIWRYTAALACASCHQEAIPPQLFTSSPTDVKCFTGHGVVQPRHASGAFRR